MAKKLLIIGGGFAGCCAAHMLQEKGFETFIVESGKILGGGVRTYWYEVILTLLDRATFLLKIKNGLLFK